MALKLVIGNKNYSSWSMRPWLALRANNIEFEEVFIPLYTGAPGKQRILDVTRSGKVPVLIDGNIGLGFAGDHRIRGRKISGKAFVAAGAGAAGARAFDFGRDAFLVRWLAQRVRHESASTDSSHRIVG